MQQSNYVEAEEAYRRALLIALDNNKMCNLGICLMKQVRIGEAKGTLKQVKQAVADDPRGVDSHVKAYERAQQIFVKAWVGRKDECFSQIYRREPKRANLDYGSWWRGQSVTYADASNRCCFYLCWCSDCSSVNWIWNVLAIWMLWYYCFISHQREGLVNLLVTGTSRQFRSQLKKFQAKNDDVGHELKKQ